MKNYLKHPGKFLAFLPLLSVVFVGCANAAVQAVKTIEIEVQYAELTFEGGNVQCPIGTFLKVASPGSPPSGKAGTKVVFQGTPASSAIVNPFYVTFGPFGVLKSNKKGRVDSHEKGGGSLILMDPKVTMKGDETDRDFRFVYTIHANNCAPVDPVIIIEK